MKCQLDPTTGAGTIDLPIRGPVLFQFRKTSPETGEIVLACERSGFRHTAPVALVTWPDPADEWGGTRAWHTIVSVEGYLYRVAIDRRGELTLHDDTTQPATVEAFAELSEDGRVVKEGRVSG